MYVLTSISSVRYLSFGIIISPVGGKTMASNLRFHLQSVRKRRGTRNKGLSYWGKNKTNRKQCTWQNGKTKEKKKKNRFHDWMCFVSFDITQLFLLSFSTVLSLSFFSNWLRNKSTEIVGKCTDAARDLVAVIGATIECHI